jgi:hypothetical protein
MNFRRITGLGLAIGAAVGIVAGCAEEPQPAPRAEMRSALPRPGGDGPFRQATLVGQASAFESFVRHARAIDGDFSGQAQVSLAVQTAAGHAPGELETGMVAYGALAALQEPAFVGAVRGERDKAALARRIEADPAVALSLPGGPAAQARASGALYAEGSALTAEGQKIKRAAYAIQRQAWSRSRTDDAAAELARVKRAGAAGYRPETGDGERLAEALAGAGRRAGPPSPLVIHSVAFAALTLLGQENRNRNLLTDVRAGACLRVAKLNYHQCLAAAGTRYEDVYCVGQHALADPGQCVIDATEAHGGRSARPALTRASYPR